MPISSILSGYRQPSRLLHALPALHHADFASREGDTDTINSKLTNTRTDFDGWIGTDMTSGQLTALQAYWPHEPPRAGMHTPRAGMHMFHWNSPLDTHIRGKTCNTGLNSPEVTQVTNHDARSPCAVCVCRRCRRAPRAQGAPPSQLC